MRTTETGLSLLKGESLKIVGPAKIKITQAQATLLTKAGATQTVAGTTATTAAATTAAANTTATTTAAGTGKVAVAAKASAGTVKAAGVTTLGTGTAKAAVTGTIWHGTGWSLGLGLGLGAWGPAILVGGGAAAVVGYRVYKARKLANQAEKLGEEARRLINPFHGMFAKARAAASR